jgi:signal transduction histidine kinase
VQCCLDSYFACIRAEAPYQIECRFKDRQTGGYRWFLGRAMPIREEQGQVVRWVGSCTDSDDSKRAEEALNEAAHRKDEFLAPLAHEFRNPLAPLRNALQIMRLSSERTVREQARTLMERQVGHMIRLVDDLLDVSRISRGKIELRRERVELATVVNQAVEAARPLVACAEHQLELTLPPTPVFVNADPTRLAQVVGNLLNNACKFTQRGGLIRLAVACEGEQAVIRVRDNGMGIAADQFPRIFDMFTQLDASLERAPGGLGIGLTLAGDMYAARPCRQRDPR